MGIALRPAAVGLALASVLYCSAASAQTITEVSQGDHGDFYYSMFVDTGDVSMTLHDDGHYSAEWHSNVNNWFGGLGWKPADERIVHYSGDFSPTQGAAYLSLYGWMENPIIDYYIVESYFGFNPSTPGQFIGSYESDGAIYDLYRYIRVQGGINSPLITTYYSVRQQLKGTGAVEGTINTANHFKAWVDAGLEMSEQQYMILATEGYQGRGTANIYVSSEPIEQVEEPESPEASKGGASGMGFWLLIGNLFACAGLRARKRYIRQACRYKRVAASCNSNFQ
jgi:hypothetical protein